MTHLINRKRFILENVGTLLFTQLSPACIDETLKQQPLSEQLHMLRTESCEAIQLLKCFQYEIPTSDFQQLCKQNYSDLFCMKDRLNLLQASFGYKSMSEDALAFYEMLSYEINRVEESLHRMGIRSLAPHEQLPDHFRDCRKALLWQQSLLLFAKLISKSADPALVLLLRAHVDVFMAGKRILQHELHCAEQLLADLIKLFNGSDEVDDDLMVMNTLVCVNFNSSAAYHYCTGKIKMALVNNDGSTKRMIQVLKWHRKELRQLRPFSGMGLNLTYPDLKSLLLDYVKNEIRYLQGDIQDDPQDATVKPPDLGGTMLTMNLNMRELALLYQLLMQSNVVPLGKGGIKEISAFLSEHIRTTGGESLSVNSLSKRYREANPATCSAMLKKLEEMILILKQDFMK